MSSLPYPIYEGLALLEGISVQNTCIPFSPIDINHVIDETSPFIRQLLFYSSDTFETSWGSDGVIES